MVFINSNVQAHELALRLRPTDRDTVTLRYAHRANELSSPVQFWPSDPRGNVRKHRERRIRRSGRASRGRHLP